MARHIFRCKECRIYTMEETCSCGGTAVTVRPEKYSPLDRYAGLKRQAKRQSLEEKGTL